MKDKIVIYQVLPRLFGNRNEALVESGTIAENGCGKFSSFDDGTLKTILLLDFHVNTQKW